MKFTPVLKSMGSYRDDVSAWHSDRWLLETGRRIFLGNPSYLIVLSELDERGYVRGPDLKVKFEAAGSVQAQIAAQLIMKYLEKLDDNARSDQIEVGLMVMVDYLCDGYKPDQVQVVTVDGIRRVMDILYGSDHEVHTCQQRTA